MPFQPDEMQTSASSEHSDCSTSNENISPSPETSEHTAKTSSPEFSSSETADDQQTSSHATTKAPTQSPVPRWCRPTVISIVPTGWENMQDTLAARMNAYLLEEFIKQNRNREVTLHMAPAQIDSGGQGTPIRDIECFVSGTLEWGDPASGWSETRTNFQNALPSANGAGELHQGGPQSVSSDSASEHYVFTLDESSPDTTNWRHENSPTPELRIDVPEDSDTEEDPLVVPTWDPSGTDEEEDAYNRAGSSINWQNVISPTPPLIIDAQEDSDTEDDPLADPFGTDEEEEAYNRAGTTINWRHLLYPTPPPIIDVQEDVDIEADPLAVVGSSTWDPFDTDEGEEAYNPPGANEAENN
ncbi:hypothetical protein SpCBS45565_g06699 [Spizellomyces sp. 'palustris']|nr:hypothetical protein SpCBS45565_g06699 [Spizellomyces sp. 'palustris']